MYVIVNESFKDHSRRAAANAEMTLMRLFLQLPKSVINKKTKTKNSLATSILKKKNLSDQSIFQTLNY
jgi:hypothetical protein